MRRSALAAFLAFAAAGAALPGGAGPLERLWRAVFPFFWYFLAREGPGAAARAPSAELRRGAAFALAAEGLYAKSVFDGLGPFGLDPGALLGAMFDWGSWSVLAPRGAAALAPGLPAPKPAARRLLLGAAGAAAAAVYLFKTWHGHYQAEFFLGEIWLLADILLGAGAWVLWRASARAGAPGRAEAALCALACWWPGASFLAARAGEAAWGMGPALLLAAAWAAAVAAWLRREAPSPGAGVRLLWAAAGWKALVNAAICLFPEPWGRLWAASAAYLLLAELPYRLLFSRALLRGGFGPAGA